MPKHLDIALQCGMPYTMLQYEMGWIRNHHPPEMIMSTIKSFDDALDFHPGSNHPAVLAQLVRTVAVYWEGFRDGLAAARSYHHLTLRGLPHDAAVQRVLREHFKAD